MTNAPAVDGTSWMTPHQAAELVSERLAQPDSSRAREIILDQAADGRIKTYAKRVAFGCGYRAEAHDDYNVGARLWQSVRDTATSACWETGDFDLCIHRDGVGWVTITIRGARLSLEDVAAIITQPASSNLGEPPIEKAGSIRWSDQEMKAAIAACRNTNREQAWQQEFSTRRHEHGWGVEAFRSIWSEARGTKGHVGRPSTVKPPSQN